MKSNPIRPVITIIPTTALSCNMRHELEEWFQREFGFLICRDEIAPFYLKNGWEKIEAPTYFMQGSGRYRYTKTSMILRCKERHWPQGDIDLCGLPW